MVTVLFVPCGASFAGLTVMLKVLPLTLKVPSVTLKVKLSESVFDPLWT